MPSTYITPERASESSSLKRNLSIASEGSQEMIGSAHFLLDVWSPRIGIVGLYELVLNDTSIGAFVLLPDFTFSSYERLIEDSHLPPEPQHAIMVAMRDAQVRDRELVCLVRRSEISTASREVYIYRKSPGSGTGRYEHAVSSLMDAFHLLKDSQALLLPYRIEQPVMAYSGAR